jgi:hypothetical protein
LVRKINGNDELQWLYQQSPADIGFSAIDYQAMSTQQMSAALGLQFPIDRLARDCEPSWLSPPPPTVRQLRAAARTACYRMALREMGVGQQAAIERAYELRNICNLPDTRGVPGGPELVATWGLAALIVRDVLVGRSETERRLEILAAQAKWYVVHCRRACGHLEVAAAQTAETEAKVAYRVARDESIGAARQTATVLDDALRAYEAIRSKHRAEAKAARTALHDADQAPRWANDTEPLARVIRSEVQLASRMGVTPRELHELMALLEMAHAGLVARRKEVAA